MIAASRISGEVRWSGDVELEGECVVAAGAILRLAPGCRVAARAGKPPLLVVEGTLVAEGTARRPVTLSASVAAAGGWVLLSHCRLKGRGGEGLHLYGDGHRLDRVLIAGFETGLFLRDGDATARGLRVDGCATAVSVGAGGRLIWHGGGIRASSGLPPPRVTVQGEFVGRGTEARALSLAASISTTGGRVDLSDCRVSGRGAEGLNIYGEGHRFQRAVVRGFEKGLVLREGSAEAEGLTISGGLEVAEGGRLNWAGGAAARVVVKGALTGAGSPAGALRIDAALSLEGGSVRLSNLLLGDVTLSALVVADCGAGVLTGRGGRLNWSGAVAVISVKGEFVARGEREFTLGSPLAAEGGRVELGHCRLEGSSGEGLTLRGVGHVLEDVRLEGFACGLALRGGEATARRFKTVSCGTGLIAAEGGRLTLEGAALEGSSRALSASGGSILARDLRITGEGTSLEIGEDGALDWIGGGMVSSGAPARIVVKGALTGKGSPGRELRLDAVLSLEGGSARLTNFILGDVPLSAFVVADCGAGVLTGRGDRLNWSGAVAVISVKGEFVARGEREFTLGSPLAAEGGRVELGHCRLEGSSGEGLTLRGVGHVLEDVRLEGFACGLALRGGEATARRFKTVSCGTGLIAAEGGRLTLEGAALEGSSRALSASGGSIRASDLTISGEGTSLEIGEDGALDWIGGGMVSFGAPARIVVKGALTGKGFPGREFRLDAALSFEGGSARLANFVLGDLPLHVLIIADCGAGEATGGAGRLSWKGVGAAAGRAVISVKGEFSARGTSEFLLDASLAAEGGRVELGRCRLEGESGEALTLRGDGHVLENVTLRGFERALSVRGGSTSARELSIMGEGANLEIAEGGSLHWNGGSLSSSGGPSLIVVKGALTGEGSPGRELKLDAALSLEGGGARLTNFILGDVPLSALVVADCGAGVLTGRGGRLNWSGAVAVISVKGEFVARGEREFTLGSPLAAEGGRVELGHCRLEGSSGEGLTLRGVGHVLEDVRLEGFACGLALRGGEATARRFKTVSCGTGLIAAEGGRLTLEGAAVEGSSRALSASGGSILARDLTISGEGTSLEIGEDGRLDWAGGSLSAAGAPARVVIKGALTGEGSPGRELRLDAALSFEGGSARLANFILGDLPLHVLIIADCGAGEATGGAGRLSWKGAVAAPGRAVISVKGEFSARGTSEFLLDASLAAEGGRVELGRCRLEGESGEALTLRGDGHILENVVLRGFSCGLSLRGGEAHVRALSAIGAGTAVSVGEKGILIWEGGGARDGETGALTVGGRAELRGLAFAGLRRGARVEGGSLSVVALDCRNVEGAAVELFEGFADLREVRAHGGTALAAAAGHAHLSGRIEGSVKASSAVRLCVAPAAVEAESLGGPRGFVIRTGSGPLGSAYRAAAAAAVGVFALWSRTQSSVVGAWAHRSWAAGGWEPGASDIDLALSGRELSSPRGRRWLAGVQSLYAAARRLFPALGELLIAEESEWRECAASGLPRPREWRRQSRLLSGRLPEIPAPSPAAARVGARLEAAMAYSRLMAVGFSPRLPEELARREAAKATIDFLRYLSPEGESGEAPPREEFRAALASSEWAERLGELARPGRAHRASCALAAAAARRWGGGVSDGNPVPRDPSPPRASGDIALALEDVDAARRDFGGAACAAVFDTLHRSYLIVDRGCAETEIARGIASWSRRTAALGLPRALPIILTPAGWRLWRGVAYQDFPLSAARWPAPGESRLETAGRAFPGERRVFWGEWSSPLPSAEEAAAALAQGSAQFRVVRRLLLREALSSRAAAHQLLTRAACLALARRGLPAPDFDLDAALTGVASFSSESASALGRAAAGDWAGFEAAAANLIPPARA